MLCIIAALGCRSEVADGLWFDGTSGESTHDICAASLLLNMYCRRLAVRKAAKYMQVPDSWFHIAHVIAVPVHMRLSLHY